MTPIGSALQLRTVLVERALAATPKAAEGLILAGQVLVNDRPVTKPGTTIKPSDTIRIRGLKKFVSRAGYKLDAAIDAFQIPIAGRAFIDIGASTGGFTDALLQRGAAFVAAIDVGKGLLHQKLRSDARVQGIEGVDLKKFDASTLHHPVEAFVADVSFTSLDTIISHAFSLLTPRVRPAEAIVLFKPQFELAKGERNLLHKGILQDQNKSTALLQNFETRLEQHGIKVLASTAAALKGTKGNQEYLLHLARTS